MNDADLLQLKNETALVVDAPSTVVSALGWDFLEFARSACVANFPEFVACPQYAA
jgi:hypothetical protein